MTHVANVPLQPFEPHPQFKSLLPESLGRELIAYLRPRNRTEINRQGTTPTLQRLLLIVSYQLSKKRKVT